VEVVWSYQLVLALSHDPLPSVGPVALWPGFHARLSAETVEIPKPVNNSAAAALVESIAVNLDVGVKNISLLLQKALKKHSLAINP
jgi:hypothetical protein